MLPPFSKTQATGQLKKQTNKQKNENQTTMLSRDSNSNRALKFRQMLPTLKYTYICIVTQFVNVS